MPALRVRRSVAVLLAAALLPLAACSDGGSRTGARSASGTLDAATLGAATLGAVATEGATPGADASTGASSSVPSVARGTAGLRDPLPALADVSSPQYDPDSGRAVLHRSGEGPAQFSVPRPENAGGIRFYVTCSPDSRFRVTMGTFFAGPCSTRFQNSGQIPLGPAGQPLAVALDVPRGTHYWIVGLAVP